MVEQGIADWLLDYSHNPPRQLWDIVLRGRTTKTPRAHTLESYNPARAPHSFGQIERAIDRNMLSDRGACMNWIERKLDGGMEEEEAELFEEYHRLELEAKYFLFGCGPELTKLREISDSLGTVSGESARIIEREIKARADAIKQKNLKPDLSRGEPILSYIGLHQGTHKR